MEYYDSHNQHMLYKHYSIRMNSLLTNHEVILMLEKFNKLHGHSKPLDRADSFLNLDFGPPKKDSLDSQTDLSPINNTRDLRSKSHYHPKQSVRETRSTTIVLGKGNQVKA